MAETTPVTPRDGTLPEPVRRLHRALLEGLLTTGSVPTADELTASAGITPTDLPAWFQVLTTADYAALDPAGRLICLYPLSAVPTHHSVRIDGQRRHAHAMCSIDALGFSAMLGRAVEIESRCAVCGEAIHLHVRPSAIVAATPATARVVARLGSGEPAVDVCCPVTVFACGEAHGRDLTTRAPGSHLLSLSDALALGETLFGDLLGETLPTTRRRPSTTAPEPAAQREMDRPILYTQSGCAESASVRAWLAQRGVAVTERNVSDDADAARALAATGVFATPLLVVGAAKVLGHRPLALARLLSPLAGSDISTRG